MMKKIILLAVSAAVFSCSKSPEDKMKVGINEYLQKNAKDPKSYEFVELKVIDTVTDGKVAKHKIENLSIENLDFKTKILDNKMTIAEHEADEYASTYEKTNEGRRKSIKFYEGMISVNKLDSLELTSKLNNKNILGFIALHKFRMKNGFGALDLSGKYFSFDKEFKVISSSENIFDAYSEYKIKDKK